jgi:hypothetical protein
MNKKDLLKIPLGLPIKQPQQATSDDVVPRSHQLEELVEVPVRFKTIHFRLL